MPIRVLHMGLGPIGCATVRQTATRKGFKIVGAVDIDPAKVGKDLGEVAGVGRKLRIKVSDNLTAAVKATKPDVVVHCTSSWLRKVMPEFEMLMKLKVPVVSTTEELMYPFYANKRFAKKLDDMARKAKVAIVGTGINPGFAMDTVPLTLTGICERVDRVTVNRIQDARIRRLPFQQKIGSGLTKEQFEEKVKAGTVRHVGLTESVSMIADALGWKLDRITDEIQPNIAETEVSSEFLTVAPGYVCGIIQDGTGYVQGEPRIRLHMEAYLGSPETYDSVDIEGVPSISMKVAGGFHGDVATASIAVNTIPKVIAAPPGLQTMRTLPIPSFY